MRADTSTKQRTAETRVLAGAKLAARCGSAVGSWLAVVASSRSRNSTTPAMLPRPGLAEPLLPSRSPNHVVTNTTVFEYTAPPISPATNVGDTDTAAGDRKQQELPRAAVHVRAGGGSREIPERKPADQRHRPARFPNAMTRSDPAKDSTRFALVGGERANRSATAAPKESISRTLRERYF
ncbi:hypothetical protein PR048_003493 [Dryococelus australis]|uniref:Uncharacterized protein n=1 Tax=Dryococelus australis TaxID=614101 RepID=A0ABQ9IQ56_9NEOP|nr:hypothetical protein PR048_003493 [Dryococelus australis]